MTKLLEQAFDAARQLDPAEQDVIARAMLRLAGLDDPSPVALTPAERSAIAASREAAERGEFASDEQVRLMWAKHGL